MVILDNYVQYSKLKQAFIILNFVTNNFSNEGGVLHRIVHTFYLAGGSCECRC